MSDQETTVERKGLDRADEVADLSALQRLAVPLVSAGPSSRTAGVTTYGSISRAAEVVHRSVDILVVDDNGGNLVALETALAPLGENIVCARSGRDALRHLLSRDFATIILDVNMPDLDGFETARMIRSRSRSAATPIIFISAVSVDEADAARGYSLGAVDYICAPIIPEVLRAKVAVFVELHRKSEEARMQAERLKQRTHELEQSQRDLRLSERMASIGTLCAGLGHDMGNLLLPVSVWIDTIRKEELPDDLQEGVQGLRTCIQYLRALAAGLRLVSLDPSKSNGEGRVRLETWVTEVEAILRNALPQGVTLTVEIPKDLPAVRIAPHRLAQVVFNLVQNAGEALRDRQDGLVRFWAAPAPATETGADDNSGGVRIGVSDNGPGMPREVMERCFDPFFTTKTRGISTGLGLSLVHGIVEHAGATLEVDSSPQHGTTFSFILPFAEESPPASAAAIITIEDSRTRALAVALIRAAGCEVVQELPEDHDSPAFWVTDPIDNLEERADEFTAGRSDRRVVLLTADSVDDANDVEIDSESDSASVVAASLTGPRGLAAELRRFLTRSAGRRSGAPSEVAAV